MPILPLSDLLDAARNRIVSRFLNRGFMPSRRRFHGAGNNSPSTVGTWHGKPNTTVDNAHNGAEGVVQLFICVDDNQHIIDRCIIKECIPGVGRWLRMFELSHLGKTPREYAMARRLEHALDMLNPGDGQFVCRARGYGNVRRFRHMLKLYLEYCHLDSLYHRIHQQKMNRRRGGRLVRKTPFPEPFLWYMFESLAKNLVAMEELKIVHGDMQAGNLLFGTPDPNRFMIYPTPKLADFGTTRFYSEAGVEDRTEMEDENCAVSFAPPELTRADAPGGAHDPWMLGAPNDVLSAQTNVWQAGMLMVCAMRLRAPIDENDKHQNESSDVPGEDSKNSRRKAIREAMAPFRMDFTNNDPRRRLPTWWQDPDARYSNDLVNTVKECLQFDPNARVNPTSLMRRIRRRMQRHINGRDTYRPRHGVPPWNLGDAIRDGRDIRDEFKMGAVFPPRRPRRRRPRV